MRKKKKREQAEKKRATVKSIISELSPNKGPKMSFYDLKQNNKSLKLK